VERILFEGNILACRFRFDDIFGRRILRLEKEDENGGYKEEYENVKPP
jgi:hypothetical protein